MYPQVASNVGWGSSATRNILDTCFPILRLRSSSIGSTRVLEGDLSTDRDKARERHTPPPMKNFQFQSVVLGCVPLVTLRSLEIDWIDTYFRPRKRLSESHDAFSCRLHIIYPSISVPLHFTWKEKVRGALCTLTAIKKLKMKRMYLTKVVPQSNPMLADFFYRFRWLSYNKLGIIQVIDALIYYWLHGTCLRRTTEKHVQLGLFTNWNWLGLCERNTQLALVAVRLCVCEIN